MISGMQLINRMKERSNGTMNMSTASGQSWRVESAKQMPSDKNIFEMNK